MTTRLPGLLIGGLAAALCVSSAWACSVEPSVAVHEHVAAPAAATWQQRQERLSAARHIQLTARVQGSGQTVEFLRNTVGTVACAGSLQHCAPLSTLPALPVAGDLLDLLLAATAARGSAKIDLPGSPHPWSLPRQQRLGDWQVTFQDWHFNPEVGFPMPEQVELHGPRQQHQTLQLERFLLR
jgi:outer membrane biogenesis lipoprotein LolB